MCFFILARRAAVVHIPSVRELSRNLGPLASNWDILTVACRLTDDEAMVMLDELIAKYGNRGAKTLLGVPSLTFRNWLAKRRASDPGKRVIWLTWAMMCEPGQIATVWDLATWGRFAKSKRVKRAVKSLHVFDTQDFDQGAGI